MGLNGQQQLTSHRLVRIQEKNVDRHTDTAWLVGNKASSESRMGNNHAPARKWCGENDKARFEEIRVDADREREISRRGCKKQTNVQACGYLIQEALLESLRIPREEFGNRIRWLLWSSREESTKGIRSEYNRTVNKIREPLKGAMELKKSLISHEIDTDDEWGLNG